MYYVYMYMIGRESHTDQLLLQYFLQQRNMWRYYHILYYYYPGVRPNI